MSTKGHRFMSAKHHHQCSIAFVVFSASRRSYLVAVILLHSRHFILLPCPGLMSSVVIASAMSGQQSPFRGGGQRKLRRLHRPSCASVAKGRRRFRQRPTRRSISASPFATIAFLEFAPAAVSPRVLYQTTPSPGALSSLSLPLEVISCNKGSV